MVTLAVQTILCLICVNLCNLRTTEVFRFIHRPDQLHYPRIHFRPFHHHRRRHGQPVGQPRGGGLHDPRAGGVTLRRPAERRGGQCAADAGPCRGLRIEVISHQSMPARSLVSAGTGVCTTVHEDAGHRAIQMPVRAVVPSMTRLMIFVCRINKLRILAPHSCSGFQMQVANYGC